MTPREDTVAIPRWALAVLGFFAGMGGMWFVREVFGW